MERRKQALVAAFFFALIPCAASAVEEEPWVAFWDDTGELELCGYKDQAGTVRIKPKFLGAFCARTFRNIIGVVEYEKGTYASHYLLKSGKKAGVGKVYSFDFTGDCESDYSIRFRDPALGKVGYLRGDGEVLIPAIYSDGSPFRNGVASVLAGAKKRCAEGGGLFSNACEHWMWEGGETLLIDKTNQVLVRDFDARRNLHWDSMKVSPTLPDDKDRIAYKGTDGRYYSFIDFEKEFQNWLTERLLPDLTDTKLLNHSYRSISRWDDNEGGWVWAERKRFIRENGELLRTRLRAVAEGDNHFVSVERVHPGSVPDGDFARYEVECEGAEGWKWPMMDLVIDRVFEGRFVQNHFVFLRTPDGYKLVSVTVRDGGLI